MTEIQKIIHENQSNPLTIVYKMNGKEIRSEYYLQGRQVHLHFFKQQVKRMGPLVIQVVEQKPITKPDNIENQTNTNEK